MEFSSPSYILKFIYVFTSVVFFISEDILMHMVQIGTYKIPEIQDNYAKRKDDLGIIDYEKTLAKYELVLYSISWWF